MSEIDKLVNRAFPDELCNVEPIPVDETTVLSLTLQKLGLEQPAEPQPEKTHGKNPLPAPRAVRPPEEQLVEVPLEKLKYHWASRIAWGAAACLLLAAAVRIGPALMGSMGARPRSPGISQASRASESSLVPASPGPTAMPSLDPSPILQEIASISSQDLAIEVSAIEAVEGENAFQVSLLFPGQSAEAVGRYNVKIDNGDSNVSVSCRSRSNMEEHSVLVFGFDYVDNFMSDQVDLVVEAQVESENGTYYYNQVAAFTLDLERLRAAKFFPEADD